MQNILEIKNVSKRFKTYESKGTGIVASLRRVYRFKNALSRVNLAVREGSITALLGRNGSGKSTLIKILTGILYADSGSVRVMGFDPWKERMKLAREIGVVLGAHSQLYWNLPAQDTFEFMRHIYGVEEAEFKKRLDYFMDALNLGDVYRKPVREMSLGEQMKCNFVASVLHMPRMVFLDEPTIGVDISSKAALKETMREMQKEHGTTFLITTHVVEDISVAERIFLLEKGSLVFDGSRSSLEHLFGNKRVVELSFSGGAMPRIGSYGRVLAQRKGFAKLEVDPRMLKDKRFMNLLSSRNILDYAVAEPGLGEILGKFYARLDRTKRRAHAIL